MDLRSSQTGDELDLSNQSIDRRDEGDLFSPVLERPNEESAARWDEGAPQNFPFLQFPFNFPSHSFFGAEDNFFSLAGYPLGAQGPAEPRYSSTPSGKTSPHLAGSLSFKSRNDLELTEPRKRQQDLPTTPSFTTASRYQPQTTVKPVLKKAADPQLHFSSYETANEVAKVRYEPLEPLNEPLELYAKPVLVQPELRNSGADQETDFASFGNFKDFLPLENREDFFLKSFSGLGFGEFGRKKNQPPPERRESTMATVSLHRRLDPTTTPASSSSLASLVKSPPKESSYRYSTKIEVTSKPQQKFLPHNQIIKATFFEDQEMSLEEAESEATSPPTRVISQVTKLSEKKPIMARKKRPGVMRMPEKFQFFPPQHKGKRKQILNRNPKSLFKEISPTVTESLISVEEEDIDYHEVTRLETSSNRSFHFPYSQERRLLHTTDEESSINLMPHKDIDRHLVRGMKEDSGMNSDLDMDGGTDRGAAESTTDSDMDGGTDSAVTRGTDTNADISADSGVDSQLEKPGTATHKVLENVRDDGENRPGMELLIPELRTDLGGDKLSTRELPASNLHKRLSAKSLYQDGKRMGSPRLQPPSSQDRYHQFLAKYQQ